jgi:hypothetical protein
MVEHPQFEYYEKKRLEVNNGKDRQFVVEFWSKKEGEQLVIPELGINATIQTKKLYK